MFHSHYEVTQNSNEGIYDPSKVNRCKFLHVLSTDKTSSIEGPISHRRSTCFKFWVSNSAKSYNANSVTDTPSLSTCLQFLKICEEVSHVFKIQILTNNTSLNSLDLELERCSSFSFLRGTI